MAKEIRLTNGKSAIIDDEDFERVNQFKWNTDGKLRLYAKRIEYKTRDKWKKIYMHRFILRITDPTISVDHKNGNTLDNQKHNLRVATPSQNAANSKLHSTNKSGYRGVSFDKKRNKWYASICVNGKTKNLGLFATAPDAAYAYDLEAINCFGEFAKTNF